jgi:hypothetical protein
MVDKQPKQVPVKLVSTTGKSAIVEWLEKDGLHRASLPADKVAPKMDQELLDAAPAWGVPWADMPIRQYTGKELQAAMYAAGMWTPEDVMRRAPEMIGILQALLGVHLGSLVEYAAKYKLNEVK